MPRNRRRIYVALAALTAVLILVGGWAACSAARLAWEINRAERADIIVYGGGLAACAAAWKAAATEPGAKVAMIIPYTTPQYGGLATVGGQNFWDVRYWMRDGNPAQSGSFARWFAQTGSFYSTADLARLLAEDLGKFSNLVTYWSMDIREVYAERRTGRLKLLVLSSLERDRNGYITWGAGKKIVEAEQFIDASEDGRLSVLSGSGVTVGRTDWPAKFLPVPPDSGAAGLIPGQEREKAAGGRQSAGGSRGFFWRELPFQEEGVKKGVLALLGLKELEPSVGRNDMVGALEQQAATLMFKVKGVRPGNYRDMIFVRSKHGVWGAYGGRLAYSQNPILRRFNESYGPRGFALKPPNAAQDGKDSSEWWVNALLIFNVDGRAYFRDRGTPRYPGDKLPGSLETDEAWVAARQVLVQPDFLEALRQFQGFEQVELVKDESGAPVTGELLYLRETVHQVREVGAIGSGTEDSNYAVTAREVYFAGQAPGEGADVENYVNRIGLGFYWLDINAYRVEDLKDQHGQFRWPVTPYLRPDYALSSPGHARLPQNPVYLPFEVLLSPRFPNLLVPGVAAGVSSLAWAELRVLPNQIVLGDAAGVAAAYALKKQCDPAAFTSADIAAVRELLVQKYQARVEK